MIHTILIDDDQSNLSSLSEKLAKHCPGLEIVAKCDSARDGKNAIEKLKPDLVFLDIEMPVMNGFVMLQQLAFRDFALIFVTAYDHYAIKAIKYSAIDYLVKPVEAEELKQAVSRVELNLASRSSQLQMDLLLEQLHKTQLKRITIPTTEGLQFINVDDIIYLEASDNYTRIFLINDLKYLVSRTLKEFEEMLPAPGFLRIHHAHLINKNYIEKYIRGEGGQVVMKNGVTLDVSKRKKSEFLSAIN